MKSFGFTCSCHSSKDLMADLFFNAMNGPYLAMNYHESVSLLFIYVIPQLFEHLYELAHQMSKRGKDLYLSDKYILPCLRIPELLQAFLSKMKQQSHKWITGIPRIIVACICPCMWGLFFKIENFDRICRGLDLAMSEYVYKSRFTKAVNVGAFPGWCSIHPSLEFCHTDDALM